MWIRSQDKIDLINATEIRIYGDESIKVNDIFFGDYKNQKRCLEVLDDIQKQMFDCDNGYVYEMPSE